MTLALYDWPWSPFCHKVRAILEHKAVPYERRDVLRGGFVDNWRRGTGKVPALVLEDRRLLADSTDIAHALEERFPTPPIVPVERLARAECHLLEDWADESLYFVNLYFQWMTPEASGATRLAFARFGAAGRVAYPLFRRRIEAQVRGQGTGRKPRAAIEADLERHLDAIEARLEGRELLIDEAPRLCDFAWFAQLVYLGRHDLGQRVLAARPATTAYVARLAARWPESLARVDAKRFGVAGAARTTTERGARGAHPAA